MMRSLADERLDSEWLEADGLGGFASGTVSGIRNRRYHALLLVATTPPTGRMVLVNGIEAWLETRHGRFALSAQRYTPNVVSPDGPRWLDDFVGEPWPRWTFDFGDAGRVIQELIAVHGSREVVLRWCFQSTDPGADPNVRLIVRPLLSGRDYHALHHENDAFNFEASIAGDSVTWRPYPGLPSVSMITNASYRHEPTWYRNFLYERERDRGLDAVEDLASPGSFVFDLGKGDAVVVLRAGVLWNGRAAEAAEVEEAAEAAEDVGAAGAALTARTSRTDGEADDARTTRTTRTARADGAGGADEPGRPDGTDGGDESAIDADPGRYVNELFKKEAARRAAFASPLARAASAYLAPRDSGRTLIAGYPWFTDWGRDTFIALRGFMTLPGGLDPARDILTAWAGQVSEGMLPNRFPDRGEQPEYNSVDASLWYVIAVYDWLRAARQASGSDRETRRILLGSVLRILAGYKAGTRFGIRMDEDGLLAAGVPGKQLTWMDAKIGDRVITPRIGKPVEVQALWLNALKIGGALSSAWAALFDRGLESFRSRFWNAERECLFDVVDVDHRSGENDASLRPNQVLAIGGLPLQLITGEHAASTLRTIETALLTPLGLRSLAPGEPGYCGHYRGGVVERDSAYHQGTAWPWLIGPFTQAWLRVHGNTAENRREADSRFLAPLRAHLGVAGLGHISELADAEAPHRPGGCPFQAWSLGEFLRASAMVGGAASHATSPRSAQSGVARVNSA